MSRIAERAGVSKATIYHYFPTKDDLINALIRSIFQTDSLPTASALGAILRAIPESMRSRFFHTLGRYGILLLMSA